MYPGQRAPEPPVPPLPDPLPDWPPLVLALPGLPAGLAELPDVAVPVEGLVVVVPDVDLLPDEPLSLAQAAKPPIAVTVASETTRG